MTTKKKHKLPEIAEAKLKYYQKRVSQAVKNSTIFTIIGGYTHIRKPLLKRGWIEKLSSKNLKSFQELSKETLLAKASRGNEFETALLSQLATGHPTNFIWQWGGKSLFKCENVFPFRNRIKRSKQLNFTRKIGLLRCIEKANNLQLGLGEIQSPRFHALSIDGENMKFLDDYRTTYCLSLIKFLCESGAGDLFHPHGQLSVEVLKFAIDRINFEILRKNNEMDTIQNELIESNDDDGPNTQSLEWDFFIKAVNYIVEGKSRFFANDAGTIVNYIINCKRLMKDAIKIWPRMHSEGYNNLWILKPGRSCRGKGIVIKKDFKDIIQFAGQYPQKRYIVQKYIEKPLLIYKTKFDIRQYALIVVTKHHLNIWMYRECYLRFSSEPYQLNDLNESIHICNHTVQKKYENGKRSNKLPKSNMWSLNEFRKYLQIRNESYVWDQIIFPQMKNTFISVALASLSETKIVPNEFEIFGCDFILDENYKPILMEINATPDMSHSTSVTSKVCPGVLKDIIKVVLDWPYNSFCDTGNFELIHSTPIRKNQK